MPRGGSSRFRWQQDDVPVAVAPWHRDPGQQRAVRAAVRVSEQTSPQYALRFELFFAQEPEEVARKAAEEHASKSGAAMDTRPSSPSPLRDSRHSVTRLVTASAMTRALEFAFLGNGSAQLAKTPRRAPLGNDNAMVAALEQRLRRWLAQGGARGAPCMQDVARWLLSRMLLVPAPECNDDKLVKSRRWGVCLCGEKGAQIEVKEPMRQDADAVAAWASGATPSDNKQSRRSDDCNVDGANEAEDEDELPPPYEADSEQPGRQNRDRADDTPLLCEREADASAPPGVAAEAMRRQSHQQEATLWLQEGFTSVRPAAAWPTQTPNRRRDRSGSLQAQKAPGEAMGRRGSCRDATRIPTASATNQRNSKMELQPTAVCLRERRCSLSRRSLARQDANEWSEDLQHFQQELRASRRDLRAAEQEHDKVQRLAKLQRKQLLKETTSKLRRNEQKQRDARAVRQMVADTLEYRDELRAAAIRVKQTAIAAQREQERLKQRTRVALGKTDKTRYGVVRFGSGPLSQSELELERGEGAASIRDVVFDLHGRRRHVQEAKLVAAESDLKSAMTKVRRVLLRARHGVELFRRYDVDRSGTLSYVEFQRLLRENSSSDWAALTHEQSAALFEHLDADGSGEVDYGELLWGFFDRRAFVKRWRERKWLRSAQEAALLFDQFDRTNSGALPLRDFQLAMDHLGVCLSDDDAKLLAVRFGANEDGHIGYHDFLAFVDHEDSGDGSTQREKHPKTRRKPTTSRKPNGVRAATPSSDSSRWILEELRAVSETQARLRRLISK